MGVREIDKIFRNKLNQAETTPKDASWERMSAMLDEKPVTIWGLYWKVAAVILLVVGVVIPLFFYTLPDETVQIARVNQADLDLIQEVEEVKLIPVKEIPNPIKVNTKIKTVQQETPKNRRPEVHVATAVVPLESPIEQATSSPSMAYEVNANEVLPEQVIVGITDQPAMKVATEEDITIKKIRAIKITYKRGVKTSSEEIMVVQEKQDTTQRKSIKQFIAQGKEVSPGELWASIRDAKDDLFHLKVNGKNSKNSK